MASSIYPNFRDHVTAAQARAADKKTDRLLFQQMDAERAGRLDRYLQLAQEMLQTRDDANWRRLVGSTSV